MTLAYDNGINLFDTAEVYAAGKYVPCLLGSGWCRPQRPGRVGAAGAPAPLVPEQVHSGATHGCRPF